MGEDEAPDRPELRMLRDAVSSYEETLLSLGESAERDGLREEAAELRARRAVLMSGAVKLGLTSLRERAVVEQAERLLRDEA